VPLFSTTSDSIDSLIRLIVKPLKTSTIEKLEKCTNRDCYCSTSERLLCRRSTFLHHIVDVLLI
jgi:hypothetical protein